MVATFSEPTIAIATCEAQKFQLDYGDVTTETRWIPYPHLRLFAGSTALDL